MVMHIVKFQHKQQYEIYKYMVKMGDGGGKFENQISRPYTAKYKIGGALSVNSRAGYESWRHGTVGQVHCNLYQNSEGCF